MPNIPPRPTFTGLVVYRDLTYRYSFLYPDGWHTAELDSAGGQGPIVSPTPGDVLTSFSVEARDLGTEVVADDLPVLREGFWAGLRSLPDVEIERGDDYVAGTLLGQEAWLTFREGDARRKRWVRVLYQGTIQARLIAQGATPADYDYWLPMFNQAMRTFQFGDWWAEVTGQAWQPTLDRPPDEHTK